jgi:hypothetical protein
MSIIKTKRNLVAAYEPLEGDVAVLLRFGAMRVLQAIGEYKAVVRDAVAIADDMEAHVDVVPLNTDEMLDHAGYASLEDFIASLTPVERAEWRRECIATLQEAILKCKDIDVVREASALLAKFVHGAH